MEEPNRSAATKLLSLTAAMVGIATVVLAGAPGGGDPAAAGGGARGGRGLVLPA
ncbi:MAG TPA: hypothetical protein VHM90_04370 [Phycisphaerae bacterium]|nr:hypothetical protein [Phycisphaerae bacterium]